MAKLSIYNTISRILFLILTPVFFRVFNFAFIWHSIYWGVITFVVLIWLLFILISPLFGRIGCGWYWKQINAIAAKSVKKSAWWIFQSPII
jgi:hypothetical protein